MWPFKKKPVEEPDNRPATSAAKAIAESLRSEPQRWQMHGDNHLKHDSGVFIDLDGWIRRPNLTDEPDANGETVTPAIHDWIQRAMSFPVPLPVTAPAEPKE